MSVRLIRQVRLFNLIVTNIPGPAFPLYLLDAPMVAGHPPRAALRQPGLGLALLSYDGRLSLGLVADWDVARDLAQVADWMDDVLSASFRAAAGVAAESSESAAPLASEPLVQRRVVAS